MTLFRHRILGPGSAGDQWVCTLHSEGVASIEEANGAWGNFVAASFDGPLKAMWAVNTKATTIITDQLDPLTWHNTTQIAESYEITGTDAGHAPSPRVCMVVGFRTNQATRSGRGRMFIPSPSASHYTAEGRFVGADCTTIAHAFGAGITAMRATLTPVIAHRATRTWTPINRVTVGDIPGTQRRRTNKDIPTYAGSGV